MLYDKEKRPIGEFRLPWPGRIRQESKASTAVSKANWRFDHLHRSSHGRWESNPQWEVSWEIVTLPVFQSEPLPPKIEVHPFGVKCPIASPHWLQVQILPQRDRRPQIRQTTHNRIRIVVAGKATLKMIKF